MSEVEVFDIDDVLGDDVTASDEVRSSGIRIFTLPAGTYRVTVDKMEIRKVPADFKNGGRLQANFLFLTEEGRKLYTNVSWEPGDDGTDFENELYSQMEVSLGMFGGKVKEVLNTAVESEFEIEVIETARTMVGMLPEEHQTYYINTKNKSELDTITFYIKADDEDTRLHLAGNDVKLRNYVKRIRLAD